MSNATFYQIQASPQANTLDLTKAGHGDGAWDQYASLHPVTVGKQVCVLGFKQATGEFDIFEFTGTDPWIKPSAKKLQVGVGKDLVHSFILGNRPYLLAYAASKGIFNLYALADDLTLSAPLVYYRNHEPAMTQGFTTIKTFTTFGQVVLLGYNGTTGYVASYTVSVKATNSPDETLPISILPAWSHMWASGWTRFAFFQFGGANFFLKTNLTPKKENVNIDHLNDVLSLGTVEVGKHLEKQLTDPESKNFLALSNVEPFVFGEGDPCFVTYLKADGQVTLNRFHSDCLGWTTVAKVTAAASAGLVVPITMPDRKVFLLVG